MDEQSVYKELCERESYFPLKYVLRDIELSDWQSIDLAKILYNKKSLLAYDTGLGKTLMASAFMYRVLNINRDKKFIFIGKLDQIRDTPKKIENATGLVVRVLDAKESSLDSLIMSDDNYHILFITVDTLNSIKHMETLFKMRNNFIGVILDEVHEYCNYKKSYNGMMLESLTYNFKYVLGLSATPLNSSEEQLYSILRIVNQIEFPNDRVCRKLIKENSYKMRCSLIVREREKNLHNGILVPIQPMEHQMTANGVNAVCTVKGDGAWAQLVSLVKLIKSRKGEQVLVYINRKEIYSVVSQVLTHEGISHGIVNGDTKNKDLIRDRFRSRKFDVLLTNSTTSLDIQCDYIVFYELTMDVKQFIGRAERGLDSKELDVYFFVTCKTFEVRFFFDKIYNRAFDVERVLGKDYSEVICVGDLLKEME